MGRRGTRCAANQNYDQRQREPEVIAGAASCITDCHYSKIRPKAAATSAARPEYRPPGMAGTTIRSFPYAESALDGRNCSALVGTPLLGGHDRKSGSGIGVQFFHDPADVVLDGALRQEHDL